MNILKWLDKNFNVGLADIETAAKMVGVDIVDGIQFLENVLAPIASDINAAGAIIDIIDPALGNLLIALTQVSGLVSASSKLTANLITNLSNPKTVASDYTDLQAEVVKFQAIEKSQLAAIQNALSLIVPLIFKVTTSTTQAIENDIKSL